MKTFTVVVLLLHLYSSAMGDGDTVVEVAPGGTAVLPCPGYEGGSNLTQSDFTWELRGKKVISGGTSPSLFSPGQRVTMRVDGALTIRGVTPDEEGLYGCLVGLPHGSTYRAWIRLWITVNVSVSISPSTVLSNGSLAVPLGSSVSLNCSSSLSSAPSLELSWTFNQTVLTSTNASSRLDHQIKEVTLDHQGVYTCQLLNQESARVTNQSRQLLVYSGPQNVSVSMGPAVALSNGTLTVHRGASVSLNCSAASYPPAELSWSFSGAAPTNHSLASANGSTWLNHSLEDIGADAQGVYTCSAHNLLSHLVVNKSTELLVYYAPEEHPDCTWVPADEPSHALFNCSWFGAYPVPSLRWADDGGDQGSHWKGHAYKTGETESLLLKLNRSQLHEGMTLRCLARHQTLGPGKEKSCELVLKAPYPTGEPKVTALGGTNVTLTCNESVSKPPANTTWRKGIPLDKIEPGPKYSLTEEGPVFILTIHNVTEDEAGLYACHSENPLGIKVLDVIVSVKSSSDNSGVVIGVILAGLVTMLTCFIAYQMYSNRHRICLGVCFGEVDDDRQGVMSVGDSDDEIFHDTVPRLPPITNYINMTQVEIHRNPSSDHEEAETGTTSSQQQQEDDTQTEQPADLLTF